MLRTISAQLIEWKNRSKRKPLILRGARQTGKTYVVNQLAESFDHYIKIDFEEDIEAVSIFRDNNVTRIIDEMSLITGVPIIEGKTLIFLDECQNCPDSLRALRYFYEKRPELHIIVTGSLLDITLNEISYSMPVGRVEYLYLYPLSFYEFLTALGKAELRGFLNKYQLRDELPPVIHHQFLQLLRSYYFVGGMPQVVAEFIDSGDFQSVQRNQTELVTSLQNDFSKYSRSRDIHDIAETFLYLARNPAVKIKYRNINRQKRSEKIKTALEFLKLTRIIHPIIHSSGVGVPLGGDIKPEHFKTAFLDIGLSNRLCRLDLIQTDELNTIREGALAEQFTAQEFIANGTVYEDRALYYWIRQSKNANAELDFLRTVSNQVIPVEVKAGTTGSLKSLHVFMATRDSRLPGVRFNMDTPSVADVDQAILVGSESRRVKFKLLSLPLYMAAEMERLVQTVM